MEISIGQGIWSGMGGSSGVGQGRKSLVSAFACPLTAIIGV